MLIRDAYRMPLEEVTHEEVKRCRMQWLLNPADGAPTFCMRRFVLEPGGHTPRHTHPWEHEVFVLAGSGRVWIDGEEHELRPGLAILVAPDEPHQFMAAEDEGLEFICLVPNGPATEGH